MTKTKAEDDLAFIKQFIDDSRTILLENGLNYIIFGMLAILCTSLTYGAVYLQLFAGIPFIWAGFFALGALAVFFIEKKLLKHKAKTFANRIYGSVWIGMFIYTVVVAVSLVVMNAYSLVLLLMLTSGGLGAAYFISSTITRNWWMFGLSFAWWLGCFALFLPGEYCAPLVFCGFVLACEVIPGFILFFKWRRLNRQRTDRTVPRVET